ncbi:unnamed protein product [Somion occarium]|uniref:Uncharacterized protein n=1 Tax=Somion occarium TaxID=3059160 RepID=A0ABP1CTR5_9APHY
MARSLVEYKTYSLFTQKFLRAQFQPRDYQPTQPSKLNATCSPSRSYHLSYVLYHYCPHLPDQPQRLV